MLKTYLKHAHRQKLRNRNEKEVKTGIKEKPSEAATIKSEKKKEKVKKILFNSV